MAEAVVAVVAFVAMEPVTAALHRFVFHGPGWALHRSHHRPLRQRGRYGLLCPVSRLVRAASGKDRGVADPEVSMATHQATIEVDQPISTVYNQWTQFEYFPEFMEGVEQVTQTSDSRLHWVADIAGSRREWDAEIVDATQRHRTPHRTPRRLDPRARRVRFDAHRGSLRRHRLGGHQGDPG